MDISNQFISQLFTHPHFRSYFQTFWNTFDTQYKKETSNLQYNSVVEDISQLLENNFKTAIQQQCAHLYQSNRYILEQLQLMKSHLKPLPHTLKTQSSTAQRDTNPKLQTSIFFQTDPEYDMKEIRKHFQDSIQNRILTNSFQIDQQDKTYQEIQDKINASLQGSINRMEISLEEKFEKYSARIQQIIQQLRKTIASVVEAMNQKDIWAQEERKMHSDSNRHSMNNAFVKKQSKPSEHSKQPCINDITIIKQHEPQIVRRTQKHKQPQRTLPNPNQNSNKTIETLNKSINLGRTKIKSLFGFKSTSTKDNNNYQHA